MGSVFTLTYPSTQEIPILISVPHCGTAFPDDLIDQYKPELIQAPDDTDWFVDRIYDFAPAMGIAMITAKYNRWVIDLNRDPQSKPLYSDGRIITNLCPTTTFLGEPIYSDERKEIETKEIERRVTNYYEPYHVALERELARLKQKFGIVLLWDCHSIRQYVLSIRQEKFPDLILGNADRTSASPSIISIALQSLQGNRYSVGHNHPFKGGYITRHYGTPNENVHTLQLEMTKVNYMDDTEQAYQTDRADKVRLVLMETLTKLNLYLKTQSSREMIQMAKEKK